MEPIFPANIAVGKAFCNRVEERKLLKEYVKYGRHAVLIAPRRYGKTSLINQILLELKIPYTIIELTLATSLEDVEQLIIKHVSELLYKILPRTIKAKEQILKLFKWLNPELVLTAGGQTLQFKPEWKNYQAIDDIAEVLKKLDAAAKLANKKVVVVIDEFQQLNNIPDHSIEASIRHAMQYSQHVSYIFSGSHRHLLLSMFNDKNRPFYNSCEMMVIERIKKNDYIDFIQRAAKEKWQREIPSQILERVFVITELHPSYINRILGYFWLTNQFPTLDKVNQYWADFVSTRKAEFSKDLLALSNNQKKVIAYFAKFPSANPSDSAIYHALNLSEASVRQSVNVLLQKDYIYKNDQGVITILDPAMRDYINLLS